VDTVLPLAFAAVALLALIGAVVYPGLKGYDPDHLGKDVLPFYLFWLISLGAIGSVAFIGMNALSVQQDITFDLGNKRLMLLRIVLGAMFGLVLSLPFGFQSFIDFVGSIFLVGAHRAAPSGLPTVTKQAILLLLPFILGFSTSLVITILNRLVDAVQAFFGGSSTNKRQSALLPAAPENHFLHQLRRQAI
jgi:hypothetical protein